MNLENKTVLIVGSNADIDGRGLGSEIDSGRLADVVIRVNKAYGDAADVGAKTDIIFTRWRSWLQTGWFSEEQIKSACEVVALNENFNFLESWKRVAADEVGAAAVSCGASANFLRKTILFSTRFPEAGQQPLPPTGSDAAFSALKKTRSITPQA